jgi:hypothetical protein
MHPGFDVCDAYIERLEEKRQVIQLLDTFIENNRLKQQATGG